MGKHCAACKDFKCTSCKECCKSCQELKEKPVDDISKIAVVTETLAEAMVTPRPANDAAKVNGAALDDAARQANEVQAAVTVINGQAPPRAKKKSGKKKRDVKKNKFTTLIAQ